MSLGLFKKVIDEACNWVHDINMHHRGESLLHPQFLDMVNYAGEKGVFTKLHSNATKIDEKMAQAILDSSLDLISFSFDGFDKAIYERYRLPGKFEPTLENILRFLRMKKETGQKKPVTVFEVIDFPDSEGAFSLERRREFEKNFEGLPLDKFIVKKAHNWAGNISIDGGIYTSGFVPCTFLWHSLVIMWDGKVGPCPQDFMGEIILGDVSKQSLKEIFNSPKMIGLRQQMITGKLERWLPCNGCDVIKRKQVIGLPVPSFKYLKQ
jgi:radical SAM protein with 4Fe4S-binding SPASM domain